MLNACYIKTLYVRCCCCWHAAIFLLFVSHLFTLYFLNIVDALHNNLCHRRSVELKHLKLNFALATTTTWGKSSFFCSLYMLIQQWKRRMEDVERSTQEWSGAKTHISLSARVCSRNFARNRERKSLGANKFLQSRVMYSNVALFHVYCCQLNWNYLLAARMEMALRKSRAALISHLSLGEHEVCKLEFYVCCAQSSASKRS